MRSLTKASASGFAWLLAQSGGARVIGFLSQIVLARLLRPADFGVVALAGSVAAIISVLIGFGVDDVLVSRARKFHLWVAPGVALSLLFSVVGGVMLLAAAPVAARLYRSPTVAGLLEVLAIGLPLGALGAVPSAFLRSHLRFRFLASYATGELLACQLLTILLAWRGCGAFSFVIPSPLAALVRSVVFWRMAQPPLKRGLRWRQLRLLLRHGSAVFGTKLVTSLRDNGDYMLLGLFASKSTVGLYFMAFKLAAVPVYALANSMAGVLFPALAQLRNEPMRQKSAVLSASRIVALTVIPVSFLQAAVAGPFLHLFYGDRWAGSAPLLSYLSVGLAFDVVPCVAGAVISANGRFKTLWIWSLAWIPVFFLLIGAGYFVHEAEGVAQGVMAFFLISAPSFSYFALRPLGGTFGDVARIYIPPTLCAAVSIGVGLLIASWLPIRGAAVPTLIVISLASAAGYVGLVRWLSPEAAKDTVRKFSLVISHAT